MLGITVGMDQKGFITFVDIPFVAQRQFPMVQTVRRTIVLPQLLFTVIDVPVVQVVQVYFHVAALRLFPMVQTAVGP